MFFSIFQSIVDRIENACDNSPMEKNIMDYGTKLKDLRDLYELTQEDVAKVLNIARSTYNQYEQQYDIIPVKQLNHLCNHFRISFDYVFNFTEIKRYKDEINQIDTKISGQRLRELRKEFNLTQSKLAQKLNIANTIISEYERGHFPISTATLYSLSNKFRISSDYLLGKTNEIKYLKKAKEKEIT